jgi:hypothetical protein
VARGAARGGPLFLVGVLIFVKFIFSYLGALLRCLDEVHEAEAEAEASYVAAFPVHEC